MTAKNLQNIKKLKIIIIGDGSEKKEIGEYRNFK